MCEFVCVYVYLCICIQIFLLSLFKLKRRVLYMLFFFHLIYLGDLPVLVHRELPHSFFFNSCIATHCMNAP